MKDPGPGLIARWDWLSMIRRPVLWSDAILAKLGAAGLGAGIFVYVLQYVRPESDWLKGDMLTSVQAWLVALVATGLATLWRARWLPLGSKFSVPAFETLEGIASDRVLIGASRCLLWAALVGVAALAPDVARGRMASRLPDETLVADLNDINAGLRSCCRHSPNSIACLHSRPLPMSSQRIAALIAWKKGFLDPRSAAAGDAESAEDRVLRLGELAPRYGATLELPSRDSVASWKRRGGTDLDAPSAKDSRTGIERICAVVGKEHLQRMNATAVRLMDAKQWSRSSFLERYDITLDIAVGMLLIAAIETASLRPAYGGLFAGAAGYGLGVLAGTVLVGLQGVGRLRGIAGPTAAVDQIPAAVYWLIAGFADILVLISLSERAPLRSDYRTGTRAIWIMSQVMLVATVRAWSGASLFGDAVDRALLLAAAIAVAASASRLRHEMAGIAARPRREPALLAGT